MVIFTIMFSFGSLSWNTKAGLIFKETRQWQIAADAPDTYNELFVSWAPAAAAAWTSYDLTADGVPDKAVVEIAVASLDPNNEVTAGVRAVGSALNRYFVIHEPEGGGEDYITLHVQTDANAAIEYYASDTKDAKFYLVGYWACPGGNCYVEKMEALADVALSTWTDSNLSGYGAGDKDIAEITIENSAAAARYTGGVRTNGSALARYFEIAEAEGGGKNGYTMFATADGANATVELWQSNAAIDFTLVGYWDDLYAPGSYSEKWATISNPTAALTWTGQTVSDIPAYGVGEIVMANRTEAAEYQMGVRKNGSSLGRILDIAEAEGGGTTDADLVRIHSQADSSSIIENYVEAVVATLDFKLVGAWVSPVNLN